MEPQAAVPQQEVAAPFPDRKILPSHQLDLVLHDGRLNAMTPAERQAALSALAHLLIEASGSSIREAGHEHA